MKLELLESRQLLSASNNAEDYSTQKNKNPAECDDWMTGVGLHFRNSLFMGVMVGISSMREGGYTALEHVGITSVLSSISSMAMYMYRDMPFIKSLAMAIVSESIGLAIGKNYASAVGLNFARRSAPLIILLSFKIPIASLAEKVCDVMGDAVGHEFEKLDFIVRV